MPASQAIVTTFDLLRHGEAEGGPCYRGSRDDPLSPLGWRQMHQAVGGKAPWSRIVSSPLRRCLDFARTLGERHNLEVEVMNDLREIHFGDWEGRRAEDLLRESPRAIEAYWADPASHPPPGGEDLTAFEQRVTEAWQTLVRRHDGEHLLVICHAGVIRSLLGQWLDIPPASRFRLDFPPACLSRIRLFHDDDGRLRPLLAFHAGRP